MCVEGPILQIQLHITIYAMQFNYYKAVLTHNKHTIFMMYDLQQLNLQNFHDFDDLFTGQYATIRIVSHPVRIQTMARFYFKVNCVTFIH